MAWFDNLHLDGKGSFRGVEFYVDEASSTAGRMVVAHRFPLRPQAFFQDQGRAPRVFNLVCFVLGTNYDVERDTLREAFEKPGRGELVHPYLGTFQVVVTGPIAIKETPREGGIARFELPVEEVGDQILTIGVPEVAAEVEVNCDAAADAATDEFVAEFSVVGAIDAVRQTAVNGIQALNSGLRSARAVVNTALNVIDDVGDSISQMSSLAASLILAPVQLASSIRGVIGATMGAISEIDAAFAELITLGAQDTAPETGPLFGDYRAAQARQAVLDLATNGSTLAPTTDDESGQGAIESANQRALVRVYQVLAIIEAARAVSNLDFESRNAVIDLHQVVSDLIDEAALDATDALFAALAKLRDSFGRRMAQLADELPELIVYVPPTTRPAIAIAYDIHGDARRETELIARNQISNPNFVEGQKALRVVVDG